MTDQHAQQWSQCLQFIKDNLDEAQFNTWFKDITLNRFENGALVINVQSEFYKEMLEERFLPLIKSAIHKVFGQGVNLIYRYMPVPDVAVTEHSSKPSPVILSGRTAAPANPFRAAELAPIDSQLNPRYTFENYCQGASNQIAVAVGNSIADNPKNLTFNPLFIYGSTGVGKTHLIQAIGIKIKENNPNARVLYVTARLFEDQYTSAVAMARAKDGKQQNAVNSFMHFYQSIDTLIIDDIQDLRNKPGTQNTFYFIFNHLHQNNRQIILSSDCAPAEMDGFEARLLGRFKWGMPVQLDAPDMELRRNVLRLKASQNGVELPDDVIEYVAANVTDSIRELEGVIVSLVAHATVMNCDINLDLAKTVVARAVKINHRTVNFEMITEGVAAFYGINPDKIFTKSRKREVSDARQIVMYLARKMGNMSLVGIGKHLDRTHATVNYACRMIEERMELEKQLRDDIDAIQKSILGKE